MPPLNYSLPILNSSAATEDPKVRTALSDIQAWANALQLPTFVTSLPSSPVDGQEIYFNTGAANPIHWHLRYNAAIGDAYKWVFLGGAPLHDFRAPEVFRQITSSYIESSDAAGDLNITIPVAGMYDITCQAAMHSNVTEGDVYLSYAVGATSASDDWCASMTSSTSNDGVTVTSSHRHSAVTAGAVIRHRHKSPTGTAFYRRRSLTVLPVRVG